MQNKKQIDWDDPNHPRHRQRRKLHTYSTWIDETTGEWMFGIRMFYGDIGGQAACALKFKVTEIIADKTWQGW